MGKAPEIICLPTVDVSSGQCNQIHQMCHGQFLGFHVFSQGAVHFMWNLYESIGVYVLQIKLLNVRFYNFRAVAIIFLLFATCMQTLIASNYTTDRP